MEQTILVIEPNTFTSGHLKTIFRGLGFPVAVCADLPSAGQEFAKPEVAFALLSARLPGVHPPQAVAYLRSLRTNAPIILLLGEEDAANAQALWSSTQSDGYVLKTSTKAELTNWLAAGAQTLLGHAWTPSLDESMPDIDASLDPDRIQRMIEDLQSPDFNICASACNELGKARIIEAVEPLIERLYEAPDELKIYVIWALGEIRDRRAVEPLVGLLNYLDSQVREGVIDALSKIKDPRTVRPLSRMLKVPDKKLRIMAIKALGLLGSREAIPVLEPMLDTPDMEIRANAQWAIRKIDGVDH